MQFIQKSISFILFLAGVKAFELSSAGLIPIGPFIDVVQCNLYCAIHLRGASVLCVPSLISGLNGFECTIVFLTISV